MTNQQLEDAAGLDHSQRPSDVLPGWRLARRLRECYRVFTNELQQRLDRHGVTVSEWSHLRVISDCEGLTQVEISRELRIEKASSTAVLDKLRIAGLIQKKRQRTDLRKIGIYLTPAGKRLVEDILPDILDVIRVARTSITDDEMDVFVQTIQKITWNFENAAQRSAS